MDKTDWKNISSKSRQHKRIKWVNDPDLKEDFGVLLVDIKTHSDVSGLEFYPLKKEIFEILKQSDDYDYKFRTRVYYQTLSGNVQKREVELGS